MHSLPPSLPSVWRGGRKGDGGCISSGTRALCLFSSNPPRAVRRRPSVSLPITPRPPSSLGIRINTTTLSLSLSYPRKPLSQRLRWGVSSNNAGNLPPSSLPLMQHVTLASLSYMAIGSCWDRWGRLYSCRRRSRRTHSLPTCESPVARRLHRRQCERGGELFAIIVPPPPPPSSPPSSVSWRPSNEFGNFIYEDRADLRGRKGSGGGEGPNRKNARCRIR